MEKHKQVEVIKDDFKKAQSILTVIGDETRQLILLVLMNADCKVGMRVGEITEKTHLSRPAVSHQLKILKEAGLIGMREEGTKNFYYITLDEKMLLLKKLIVDIEGFMNKFIDK